MNILFLTLSRMTTVSDRGIYPDLIRKLASEGHRVDVVSPYERRFKEKTKLTTFDNIRILKVWTFNIQKTNIIEKGFATLLLENQFQRAIRRWLGDVKYDLILFATPPITFTKVVSHIKKRDGAKSYLLLKDIFPQNAVDLGMIKRNDLLHKYFRNKEIKLYSVCDYIGCMSPANVEYLLRHNPQLDPTKVEVNPNSVEPIQWQIQDEDKNSIRARHNIPVEKPVFVYGGNLGKPQGISFLIDVLESNMNKTEMHFLIVGSGTEYPKIKAWFDKKQPQNATLLNYIPKKEYDTLVQSCDVGMIFLDRRFTIPNFPSRLLSYLEIKLPVLAATDTNTDLGKIITENGFGLWCESGDIKTMNTNLTQLTKNLALRQEMGKTGFDYFLKNYTSNHSCQIIMSHFKENA